MKRRRTDRLGLPVLLLAAILSTAVTPAALSAGLRPESRAASTCPALSPQVAARAATDGSNRGLSASGDSSLGTRGEVIGRVLSGQTANGTSIAVELPVESFVGEAVDDVVVYTTYTPESGNEVRALDLVSGCDTQLATPSEIVRSAALSRDARSLYVHRVKKSGRSDAGVVRFDLSTGDSKQVMSSLRPSDRLGPIFGTELHWSVDGLALAVQSCGIAECLTRVLDVEGGTVRTYDAPGQGQFIELNEAQLITYAACGGMPCAVIATDLATGIVEVTK